MHVDRKLPELDYWQRMLVDQWLTQWKPLGLLKSTYRKVYNVAREVGLDDEDIEQAALLGVCLSALSYDSQKVSERTGQPITFGSYAAWRVRSEVQNAINKARGCRWEYREDFDPPKMRSLDEPLEGGLPWVGTIEDVRQTPVEEAERRESADRANALLRTLPKRARVVIRLRFGINGPTMTLTEIAWHLGISKERVRQIETAAMRKMAGEPDELCFECRRRRARPFRHGLCNACYDKPAIRRQHRKSASRMVPA